MRLGISVDVKLLIDPFGDGERLRFRFGKGGGLSVCLEILDDITNGENCFIKRGRTKKRGKKSSLKLLF